MLYTDKVLKSLSKPPMTLWRFQFQLGANNEPTEKSRYPIQGLLYAPINTNQDRMFTPMHPRTKQPLMEQSEKIDGYEFADAESEAFERYEELVHLYESRLKLLSHLATRYLPMRTKQPRIAMKCVDQTRHQFELYDTSAWIDIVKSEQAFQHTGSYYAVLNQVFYNECGMCYTLLGQTIDFTPDFAIIDGLRVRHADIGKLLHGHDVDRAIVLRML